MKKRLIALLLAFAMCLSLAAGAAAEELASDLPEAEASEEASMQEEDAELLTQEDAEASLEDVAVLPENETETPSEETEPISEETAEYFSEETVYLPVGSSVSLLAEGISLPEGASLSADSDVITVSAAGDAAGVSAGSATVTLQDADGNTLDTVKVICYQTGSYFTQDAYYVKVGGTLELKTALDLPDGAAWVSGTDAHVSVSASGELTGEAVGRSTISLTLQDGTVLDTTEAYAFEPTSYTVSVWDSDSEKWVTGQKAESGILLPRKVTTENANKSRTYYLFKQQYDKKNHRYLYSNGCSVTAVADILTGYGFYDADPVWLQETYIPYVAENLGIDVGTHLDNDSDDRKTLGFYGLQQTMLAMGVSCEIKNAYGDIEGAAEDITAALSEGRPVILLVNKSEKVNGNPSICSGWHYLYLSGIDEDGYVLNSCSSSANVQTSNALNGKTVKLTVTDLLTHYRKSSKQKRKTDSDFFLSTKKSGTLTYLECTSTEPGLAENVITGKNKKLTASSKVQKVSLNCSARGDAALSYQSSNSKVTVSSKGVVTVPKNFVGKVTITVTSAETSLYQAASKEFTVTVSPAKTKITSCYNKSGKRMRVKWKKSSSVSGYQIQYSTSSQFKNAKKVTVKGADTGSKTISGLTKKKTYYVRVRTWKTVDGKTYYSSWSSAKKVTIKK